MRTGKFAVVFLLAILAGTVSCATRRNLMVAAPAVPAAQGEVKVKPDKNGNLEVNLEVQHLAKPTQLTPPANSYVVWLQGKNGQAPQNLGKLQVGDDLKAKFTAVTPERNFDLFITAEQNPTSSSPTGVEVMRTSVQA